MEYTLTFMMKYGIIRYSQIILIVIIITMLSLMFYLYKYRPNLLFILINEYIVNYPYVINLKP